MSDPDLWLLFLSKDTRQLYKKQLYNIAVMSMSCKKLEYLSNN